MMNENCEEGEFSAGKFYDLLDCLDISGMSTDFLEFQFKF